MTNSIKETYALRKIYSHPSSVALRTPPKPPGEVANVQARHRAEDTHAADRKRAKQEKLNRDHAARRARLPHISFEADEKREQKAMTAEFEAENSARAKRQKAQLDIVKERHMLD